MSKSTTPQQGPLNIPPPPPPPPPLSSPPPPHGVVITLPPSSPRACLKGSRRNSPSPAPSSSPLSSSTSNKTAGQNEGFRKAKTTRRWRTAAAKAALEEGDDNRKPLTRSTSNSSSSNRKSKKPSNFIRRSFSFGYTTTNSSSCTTCADGNSRNKCAFHKHSSTALFGVTFAEGDQLVGIQAFEPVHEDCKGDIWYVAKELKTLLQQELKRNRKYEEGELDEVDEEEIDQVCWRGLEHILEGDERSGRIRKTVQGILNWYVEARQTDMEDPEKLRVISKARTKVDGTNAQKRASGDALFVKEMRKGEFKQGSKSQSRRASLSSHRAVKRLSKNLSEIPKLNWSPKPRPKVEASES